MADYNLRMRIEGNNWVMHDLEGKYGSIQILPIQHLGEYQVNAYVSTMCFSPPEDPKYIIIENPGPRGGLVRILEGVQATRARYWNEHFRNEFMR